MKGLALIMVLLPLAASAATITVNTTRDNTRAGDGWCTLREAIASVALISTNTVIQAIRGRSSLFFVAVLVLAALCLIPGGHAFADTFNVTKTDDTNDGSCDSDCSLREAVIAANQHPGADTVVVPAGTYVLTLVGSGEDQAATGDLDILDDLTISGAGQESTSIDGNGTDRVFDIHGAVVIVMSGVNIQNGSFDGGGGIANAGTLTMTDCGLFNNRADYGDGGAIANTGTLTLMDCTLSNNSALGYGDGGGIANSGAATLTNCMLSYNQAGDLFEYRIYGDGGGIFNASTGTLTMANCTLWGNSGSYGGGLYNHGAATLTNCRISGGYLVLYGGGIYNYSAGTLTLTNCTVSGNSAVYGGGIVNGGTLTLTNSTVAGNTACRPSSFSCYDDDIDNYGTLILHETDSPTPAATSSATPTLTLTGMPSQTPTSPPTLTPTPTNTPTQTPTKTPSLTPTMTLIRSPTASPTPPCVGDCDGNGEVTVNELIQMVNIALGNAPLSTCTGGDADHNGDVTIDEILRAVTNALNGCA